MSLAQNVSELVCIACDARYAEGEVPYTCPACGPARGLLDVRYDYDRLSGFKQTLADRDERTIWRYRELLPLSFELELPVLRVGWTPVYDFPRAAKRFGLASLRVKDDGQQPTGSFKDRASAVGTVKARELGFDTIACSSTGNAASSLAGFSATQGLKAMIFVPATAPEAKVAQLRAFGATVFMVQGPYEAAFDLCQEAIGEYGWYNRNCAINPYLVEGKRTCGLELAEQCAADPPDVVAVSVGDGCTVAGIWKGMDEMRRLGVWDRVPRLLAVQAEGAAPLVAAAAAGTEDVQAVPADTVADSISVGVPRNGVKALRAVAASGGQWITVSDLAIQTAAKDLAASTGVFAEPAAAAAMAGVLRGRETGAIGADERVLVVVTGNGLKDVRGSSALAPEAHLIEANMDAVRLVVGA